MPKSKAIWWVLVLLLCLVFTTDAEARRKRSRRKRYTGPPPTHPIILWSRTLSESTDREQRKIAAFKLSQYSQTIYQESIVSNIIRCMKDSDVQIKVLCAKAMGKAGTQSQSETVRRALIERYQADPELRSTIVRTFLARKDTSSTVHDLLMDSVNKSKDDDELATLLSYFEVHGSGTDKFADTFVSIYKKKDNIKVKRAAVKVLAERGRGQANVVELFAECADHKDTPLALNCLAGLQQQARKTPKAWEAVAKTVMSDDPDMLMATLDVITVLPEAPHPTISARLIEILDDIDDAEIQEKSILAMEVCGDHSEAIVSALGKAMEKKDSDESVRIAAALAIGRQADLFPDRPKELLSKCKVESKSQPLRTACQLGLQKLEERKSIATQNKTTSESTPSPTPGSTVRAPAAGDDPDADPGEAPPSEIEKGTPTQQDRAPGNDEDAESDREGAGSNRR